MDTHRWVVREIAKEVKAFHEQKRPFRVYHGSTYSTRAMHDPHAIVHTSDLDHILDINSRSRFVMVEPNVPMNELVKATLKHNLMPPVVPAFPGTTVGGTFAGTAGGSSSFKHGFFDRAVSWIEIVLADGTITRASKDHNPELLSGMIGTLGTIGITTLFQVRLVLATSYVDLRYQPVANMAEALALTKTSINEDHVDFVETLIYGKKAVTYGVVTVGKLSDAQAAEDPICSFGRAEDPWFHEHVLNVGKTTDRIPIYDYLFRYDRGSFGMGEYCFGRILPMNNWTRWLTDSALHSNNLTRTIHSLRWADHFFIQDLVVPQESTTQMLQYLEENLIIYPLRLCPIRQWPETHAIMRPNPTETEWYMSIGLRGYTEGTICDPINFERENRDLEWVLHKLKGMKWLYSRNFYTEEEFWQIYSRPEYDALRKQYRAEYLPSVYDKIRHVQGVERMAKPEGFWNWVFSKTSVLATKRKAWERHHVVEK